MKLNRHRRHFKEDNTNLEGRRSRTEREGGRRSGRGGGAKTFRRARALLFLQKLRVQRDVLRKQLDTPELQTINPVVAGELKAVEMMLAEFISIFELQDEVEMLHNENDSQVDSERKDD